MISALDSELRVGRRLYSHSASLQPGVQKGSSEFNVGGSPLMD